jgi:hypothetical protein
MLRFLKREFGYEVEPRRGKGQHLILVAPDRRQLVWGFGRRDMAPVEVRDVLVKSVGLTLEEAREAIKRV